MKREQVGSAKDRINGRMKYFKSHILTNISIRKIDMKKIVSTFLKITFASLLTVSFSPLSASAASSFGTVYQIITNNGGIVYFHITGASYTACAKNQRYVIDTNSQYGKGSYALILSSYLVGKSVGVLSPQTCNLIPNDAEDVTNVYTQ